MIRCTFLTFHFSIGSNLKNWFEIRYSFCVVLMELHCPHTLLHGEFFILLGENLSVSKSQSSYYINSPYVFC